MGSVLIECGPGESDARNLQSKILISSMIHFGTNNLTLERTFCDIIVVIRIQTKNELKKKKKIPE